MCLQGSLPSPADWVNIHDRVRPVSALAISATKGNNLPKLLEAIEKALLALSVRVECVLPYSAGELLAEMHKVGTIVEESYVDVGTRVVAFVPRSLAMRLKKMAFVQPEKKDVSQQGAKGATANSKS